MPPMTEEHRQNFYFSATPQFLSVVTIELWVSTSQYQLIMKWQQRSFHQLTPRNVIDDGSNEVQGARRE